MKETKGCEVVCFKTFLFSFQPVPETLRDTESLSSDTLDYTSRIGICVVVLVFDSGTSQVHLMAVSNSQANKETTSLLH